MAEFSFAAFILVAAEEFNSYNMPQKPTDGGNPKKKKKKKVY